MTAILAAVFAALISLAAYADQTDPRLDGLFQELRDVESRRAATRIEARIWRIWTETDNEPVRSLMAASARAMERQNYDAALGRLDTVVQLAPDYAEGWNRRATVRYLAGDYDGSLEDIERVLALEPRHFGALAGRGLCLVELDRLEEALKAFEAALEINPHAEGARVNREYVLEELDRLRI
ncbi:MAG: tetratricopeptide repeat protein [Rhodovibrionaceae bacterium]|nr:tetratricopeptide repeat protein [Rhodovibrionaceae bacterium]